MAAINISDFRLFMLHEHIDHAMLEDLKLTNGLTELFALAAVLDGFLVEFFHTANGFRANGQNTFIDGLFQHSIALDQPPQSRRQHRL